MLRLPPAPPPAARLSTTIFHTPSFTHHLSHTIFHTPSLTHHLSHTISHTPSLSTIFVNHHLSHTIFHTLSFTHHLSHTIFHTLSFTHHLSHTIFHTPSLTHHLSHTIFVNHLCQPPSFTHHLSPSLTGVSRGDLGDIHLPFVWQAWHLVTSTFILRGRRGTYYGTALRAWTAWSPVTPRHFAWQAWHLWPPPTFVLHGRRGTCRHPPSFCVAGVALIMALRGALGRLGRR